MSNEKNEKCPNCGSTFWVSGNGNCRYCIECLMREHEARAPAAAPLGAGEALRGMVAAFWGDMDEEHKTSFRKEFPGHVVIRAEAALSSVPVAPAPYLDQIGAVEIQREVNRLQSAKVESLAVPAAPMDQDAREAVAQVLLDIDRENEDQELVPLDSIDHANAAGYRICAERVLASVPVDPAPQGPVAEESEHLARIIAPWFGFDPDKEWKRCIGNAAEIKAATLAKTKGLKNPGRDLLFEAAMMLGFWPDGAMEPYDKSDADDLRRKVHEYLRVTNPLAAQGPAPQAAPGREKEIREAIRAYTLNWSRWEGCRNQENLSTYAKWTEEAREKLVALALSAPSPVSAPAAEIREAFPGETIARLRGLINYLDKVKPSQRNAVWGHTWDQLTDITERLEGK